MRSLLALAIIANTASFAQAAVSTTQTATVQAEALQTETTKVVDTTPKANPLGNFTLAMDSEANKTVTGQNNSYDGDIETYEYLKVGYKITDKLSTTAVQTWTQRLGYKENSSQTTMEDFHLRLTRSDLFSIGKMSVTGQARVYLPTSDLSKEINQVAQFRGYLIGGMDITKRLSTEILLSPRYYVFEEGSKAIGRSDYRMLYSGGLKYAVTDALAVESTLGIYSKKKVGVEMAHYQDYSTSLYYTLNKHVSLNGGIRAVDGAIDTDKDGLELYNHNASEYFAIASIGI